MSTSYICQDCGGPADFNENTQRHYSSFHANDCKGVERNKLGGNFTYVPQSWRIHATGQVVTGTTNGSIYSGDMVEQLAKIYGLDTEIQVTCGEDKKDEQLPLGDIDSWIWNEDTKQYDRTTKKKTQSCECGLASIGYTVGHSDWCPLYTKDNK